MTTYTDPQGKAQPERRANTALRELFDGAYAMISPFFDKNSGWGGRSLEHLAFRVLRENYPALSAEDVHVIIVAAHRVYIQRNPDASDHLPRPEELRRGA